MGSSKETLATMHTKKERADPMPVPVWLLARGKETPVQWKRRKREQLEAVLTAFHRYQEGCAYCPVTYADIELIETRLAAMRKAHARRG